MPPETDRKTKYTLASIALRDAYTDFILSRQAMLCTPGTLEFYNYTAGAFLSWLENNGVTSPDMVTARYVRAYLAELAGRGLSDWTCNDHARAIRTLLRFWTREGYSQPVKFDMPKVALKKLPTLDAAELRRVITACRNPRDKALIMVMADTGLRRAELLALTWADIDIPTGSVKVLKGKGGKYRVTFVGAKTRRALLKYRRALPDHDDRTRIFPLTQSGLRSALLRIGNRAGLHLNAHTLRRTFATLALRGGMSIAHVSALLGHAEISTTQSYLRLLTDDLQDAHRRASPVDRL